MKKVLCLSFLALALTSCGNGKKGWSDDDKNAFLRECTSGSKKSANMNDAQAKDYCDCMLGKLETKYPNALSVTGVTDAEMDQFAAECIK